MAGNAFPRVQTDLAATCGFVNVGTSTTVVLGNNPGRAEVTVVNDGANVVYLQLATAYATPAPFAGDQVPAAPTAVLNQGIRLNATGGSWTSKAYTGPLAGIAVTGATNVTVTEV